MPNAPAAQDAGEADRSPITIEGVSGPNDDSRRTPDERRARMAGTMLYTNLSVSFDEIPVDDALRAFQEAMDFNIIGLYARQRDDGTLGPGIDRDITITFDVENLPALTVLEMILMQCETTEDVTWQIRDAGFMEVGPKSRLNRGSAVTVRRYDVTDLLGMIRITEYRDTHAAPDIQFRRDSVYDLYDPRTMISDDGRIVWPTGVHRPRTRPVHSTPHGRRPTRHPAPPRQQRPTSSPRDALPDSRRLAEEDLLELITNAIEPNLWQRNGGNVAYARIHRDHLIVRAPDYIHRRVGGYPEPIPPEPAEAERDADASPDADESN